MRCDWLQARVQHSSTDLFCAIRITPRPAAMLSIRKVAVAALMAVLAIFLQGCSEDSGEVAAATTTMMATTTSMEDDNMTTTTSMEDDNMTTTSSMEDNTTNSSRLLL